MVKEGDRSGWEGVNCGLRISRKPVSTKEARLEEACEAAPLPPLAAGAPSANEVLEDSLSLLFCGAKDFLGPILLLEAVR